MGNLSKTSTNFKDLDAQTKMKNVFEATCHLLQGLPDYENMIRDFGHPIQSSYINNLLLSCQDFDENIHNIVSYRDYDINPGKSTDITAIVENSEVLPIQSKLLLSWSSNFEEEFSSCSSQLFTLEACRTIEMPVRNNDPCKTKRISRGMIVATAKVINPSRAQEEQISKTKDMNNVIKRVSVEDTVTLKGKEEKIFRFRVIDINSETTAFVSLSESFGKQTRTKQDSPKQWIVEYERVQNMSEGTISYKLRNLTVNEVNISEGYILGEAQYDKTQVKASNQKKRDKIENVLEDKGIDEGNSCQEEKKRTENQNDDENENHSSQKSSS